jgi:hypothetical protein
MLAESTMADRHPSFFGPVLPQTGEAEPAFSFAELQRIQANRLEADLVTAAEPAWPAARRFTTVYPPPLDDASKSHKGLLSRWMRVFLRSA